MRVRADFVRSEVDPYAPNARTLVIYNPVKVNQDEDSILKHPLFHEFSSWDGSLQTSILRMLLNWLRKIAK